MKAQVLEFLAEFAESRIAVLCAVIAAAFFACAALAPLISPIDPYDLSTIQLSDARKAPGGTQDVPAPSHNFTLEVKHGNASGRAGTGEMAIALSVAPAQDVLILSMDAQGLDISQVRLRDLPSDIVVEGARKHPVRNEWTLSGEVPEGGIRLVPQGAPEILDFRVTGIIDAVPESTGMVFLLGTDGYGRDMLSAIIYGIRISVVVGLVAATGAMILGTGLGLIAAWRGGWVDALIMRVVDFMLSIPSLMMGLLVLTILGKGVDRIIFAVILLQWTVYARTTRSVALAELRKDYVEAARGLRFSALRINLQHILPNCLPPLLVLLTINIAGAITLEASLSFLGVGLPLTQPSLGMLISNGYEYMFSNMYWIAIFPGIVLLFMIISINVVGDRLRDMLNPQLKR